jgi:hypothetical protein
MEQIPWWTNPRTVVPPRVTSLASIPHQRGHNYTSNVTSFPSLQWRSSLTMTIFRLLVWSSQHFWAHEDIIFERALFWFLRSSRHVVKICLRSRDPHLSQNIQRDACLCSLCLFSSCSCRTVPPSRQQTLDPDPRVKGYHSRVPMCRYPSARQKVTTEIPEIFMLVDLDAEDIGSLWVVLGSLDGARSLPRG